MATSLSLHNTTNNGITDTGDGIVYDMTSQDGSGADDTAVTNTTASGTEIQLTKTAGGSTVAWISGRVPAGGVTLTSATNVAMMFIESNMSANCGLRARFYRYQPGGTVTELGGGPFDDGVEFSAQSLTQMIFTADWTDQAFNENDRLLMRAFLTNIGTMGGGYTCTAHFERLPSDSYVILAETVTFKSDAATRHFLSIMGAGK